jgi:exodeoxyribonuclease V beta subunit
VRRKFRAVLVDEFQDTDALQVAILSGLFAEAGVPIFLIGDPKQAIYGFRGADIYSYLEASRRSQNVYTLTANRRSRPGLVAAVNAIFTQRPLPFLIPGIEFVPASAVRPPDASAGAALALWYLDSRRMRPDGRPVAKGVAEGFIARAVAADIARRLADARPGLRAGDIAVLVRTNRQARLTKAALARQRVPAVVCSAGDVFESPEAEELLRILAGIAEPSDPRRLRAALATAVMGAGVEEILACGLPEAGGDERLQRLRGYHQVWRSSGFMAMFRRLVSAEQVKPRLLGAPDGERRLTNLLHLAELLHRAESEESLGMGGLVKWLARRRRPEEPQREEHQLRLESDAGAVQIVTIHKSKGLQYPVVYCPFAWDASTVGAQAFFYHEPGAGHSLRLALEGEGGRGPMVQAERERLSENLRLLYVALTRAEERLVMVWGRINLTETSAPAYLFHSAGEESPAAEDEEADVLERLRAAMGAKTDADLLKDLDNLERRAAGAIAVVPVPAPPPAPALKPPSAPGRPLACRRFDGAIDRAWKTASYTLLVRAADHAGDGPARDHDAPALWPAPETPGEAPAAPDEPVLFAFPRGARAGTFFHEILEKDDFAPETGAERRQRVLQALSAHRFESAWCDPVCRRVSDLARLPLGAGAAGPRLAEVPAEDRRPEMEFYFPLKRLTPQSLERFFTRFSTAASGALGPAFCRQLGRLEFAPLEGYMKGFIDLVFRHEGRFFLIDWKSNHLGDRLEDYRRERLSARMQEELYTLQYHLYTLALHRYLALRVPGYRYEAHFGGVAYVFLRGVDPGRGPGFGVFSDRPAPDLVRAMEEELIAGHA